MVALVIATRCAAGGIGMLNGAGSWAMTAPAVARTTTVATPTDAAVRRRRPARDVAVSALARPAGKAAARHTASRTSPLAFMDSSWLP
jgi:hypothetical protein